MSSGRLSPLDQLDPGARDKDRRRAGDRVHVRGEGVGVAARRRGSRSGPRSPCAGGAGPTPGDPRSTRARRSPSAALGSSSARSATNTSCRESMNSGRGKWATDASTLTQVSTPTPGWCLTGPTVASSTAEFVTRKRPGSSSISGSSRPCSSSSGPQRLTHHRRDVVDRRRGRLGLVCAAPEERVAPLGEPAAEVDGARRSSPSPRPRVAIQRTRPGTMSRNISA